MEDGNNGRFPRITRKAEDEDEDEDEDDHEHEHECECECDITLNGYKGLPAL
jgi:hypothetical protein